MLYLRSYTLTMPTNEMRKSIFESKVEDCGSINKEDRPEDPTVNKLEDLGLYCGGSKIFIFLQWNEG